jgi:hypothetical protein
MSEQSPRLGEIVDYTSPYRTGIFDAVIRNIRHDGTVDIEVYINGLKGRDAELQTMRIRGLVYGERVKPRGLPSVSVRILDVYEVGKDQAIGPDDVVGLRKPQ